MVPGAVSNSSETGLILQGGRAERREQQQGWQGLWPCWFSQNSGSGARTAEQWWYHGSATVQWLPGKSTEMRQDQGQARKSSQWVTMRTSEVRGQAQAWHQHSRGYDSHSTGTRGEGLSLSAAFGWRRGFSQLCSQQPDYTLHCCTIWEPALSTGSPAPQRVLKSWTPPAVQKLLIYEFHGIIKCDCFLQ